MIPQKRDPLFPDRAHECSLTSDWHIYGPAIEDCMEDNEGKLWAGGGEYVSQVNFCPICGFEAKVKVSDG